MESLTPPSEKSTIDFLLSSPNAFLPPRSWQLLINLYQREDLGLPTMVCDLLGTTGLTTHQAQVCLDEMVEKKLLILQSGTGRRFRSVRLSPIARVHIQQVVQSRYRGASG